MSSNTLDSSPSKSSDQWNDMSKKDEDSDGTAEDILSPRVYEPKQTTKFIRVLTVLAYILSVSMAAIMLSLYYIFLWDPSPSHLYEPGDPLALREDSVVEYIANFTEHISSETNHEVLYNTLTPKVVSQHLNYSRPEITSAATTPLQFPSDMLYDEDADKMAAAPFSNAIDNTVDDNEGNPGASMRPTDFIDVNNDTSFPQAKGHFWEKLLEASGAARSDSIKR